MRRAHEQVLGEFQPALHAFDASAAGYALGGASKTALLVDAAGAEHPLEHLGAVEAVALGARWLATGSRDMGVRFFGLDGALHRIAKGHYNSVRALCWLDDDTLVSVSADGRVGIFHADEARMQRSVVLPDWPRAVAIGDAGIVVGTASAMHVLDPQLKILETIDQPATSLRVAGTTIAARWRDVGTRVEHAAIYEGSERIWTGEGTAIAIHAGMVAVGELTGRLQVRRDGEVLFEATPHDSAILAIHPTPHGWLTGGGDATAALTSFEGGALGGVSHRASVARVGMMGDALITVGDDAEVALWNPDEAKALTRPRQIEPVRTVQLASGAAIAFGEKSRFGVSTKEGFHVLDANDAHVHEVIEPSEPHWYAVFGSGVWGTRIGADRTLALMHSTGVVAKLDGFYAPRIVGSCVLTDVLECHRLTEGGTESLARIEGNIHGSSIAPSGRWAWLASKESILVDVDDGELQRLEASEKASFSHDDAWVAYATNDAVVLHDVRAGKARHRLPIARVWGLQWAPDTHRLAITTSEKIVRVVDARSGQIELTLRASETGAAGYSAATWLPGQRLATSAQFAKAAIFERDGTQLATIQGINSAFVSCRVVGERVLAWSNVSPNPDLTLQLWTFDGELVATLSGHQGERFWQVNPSRCGRWVVSLVDGDRARVWATEDGACTILPVTDVVGAEAADDACVTVERNGRVSVFEL